MQVANALYVRPPAVAAVDEWRIPPARLTIEPSHVHVWRINLESASSPLIDSMISHDERARAMRFRFDRDRRRFIAVRAAVRTVLARYLDTDPRRLEFETNPFGKPFLTDGYGARGLSFNLSHSNELALLAVTTGRDIGIDIEFMRADYATDEIAENFFSRAEIEQLHAIAPQLKTAAFFNCWTRKEAYIKALGEGLSLPLDQFDVSIAADEPPALIGNRVDPGELSRWSLYKLVAAPGYAATVAVEGTFVSLKLWDCRAIC